jgi:mannonate dehydratase
MSGSKSGNVDRDMPAALVQSRRTMLKLAMLGGGGAVANLFSGPLAHAAPQAKEQTAQTAVERATRGMPSPRIKDVTVIDVGAGTINDCTVVKVTTDQPGLYGYGCATITFPGGRQKLVRTAVEQYLKPLVVGRTTDRIEEIWQLCYMSSYYKNDNVQNCAIGGICDALWDIKGRQAGMPVYQLVGGKCRDAAEYYLHVGMGNQDPGKQLVENTQKLIAQGCRDVLVAMFTRDGPTDTIYGQPKFDDGAVAFDRDKATRKVLAAFETFRKELPPEIGLAVDVHSLLDPVRAVEFAKDLEEFKLFYCEDVLAPEEAGHYPLIRQLCSTPLAIGELWDNPHEWQPLVQERLIDYVRCHVSHIGGFTPARKIAAFAENFEVKFAWHGGPNSPVGHMTNLTLDLTNNNFGIHEHFPYSPLIQEIFQGSVEVKDGYAWISEKPGWGIEVDEALAAKHPITDERPNEIRLRDGSVIQGTS